jgi:hypothetical protein
MRFKSCVLNISPQCEHGDITGSSGGSRYLS